MNTENNVSQAQKMIGDFQGAATEQVGRVVEFWSELGRNVQNPMAASFDGTRTFRESFEQLTQLAKKNMEHGQATFAELLKLSRDSFTHAAEMAAELQRIQLGAFRKSAEAARPVSGAQTGN